MSVEAKLKLQIAEFTRNYTAAKNHAKKESAEMARASGGVGAAMTRGLQSGGAKMAGAISFGTVLAGVKGAMSAADDIADLSVALNDSAEALQRVDFAAKQAGAGGVEQVGNAMLKLERNLSMVENAKAAAALEHFGLTADRLMSMPIDEKILALSGAFQEARKDGTGMADLMDLVGKSGGDLIPLLGLAKDELEGLFKEAPAMAEAEIVALARMNDQADALLAKLKSWGSKGVGVVLTGFQMGGDIVKGLFGGKSLNQAVMDAGLNEGARQNEAKEKLDARKKFQEITAQGIKTSQEKAAADAAESEAAEKAKTEIEKLADAKKKAAAEELSQLNELTALREKAREGEIKSKSPNEQARIMRDQLSKSLGIDINGMADVERGMKSLQDEADKARAGGDKKREKMLLEQLVDVQGRAGEFERIAGGIVGGPQKQGSFQNLVDQIFDRDPAAEQIAAMRDSLRKQDDLKRTMDDIFKKMDDPVPRDFFSNFGQS